MGEVQVNEDDDGDLLDVLDGLDEEVPEACDQRPGQTEQQCQANEHRDDGLVIAIELGVLHADSVIVLVGVVRAVAHAGDGLVAD